MCLLDEQPLVRQSAAVALGCLGRRAEPYMHRLKSLLADSNPHVRYASLLTLGGMTRSARTCSGEVIACLTDSDYRVRMAALRALKCMGYCAEDFVQELYEWQGFF